MTSSSVAFLQFEKMCALAKSAVPPADALPGAKKVLTRGNTAYFVDVEGTWHMVTYFLTQAPIVRVVPTDWVTWLQAHTLLPAAAGAVRTQQVHAPV